MGLFFKNALVYSFRHPFIHAVRREDFNAKSPSRKDAKRIPTCKTMSPNSEWPQRVNIAFSFAPLHCYPETFCFFNNLSEPSSSRAEAQRSQRKEQEEKFLSADSAPLRESTVIRLRLRLAALGLSVFALIPQPRKKLG